MPLTAALAAAVPAMMGWRGVDWPAQVHRVEFFRLHGWAAFDTGWYGGHYPLAYSILYPLLATVAGYTVVSILSAAVASWAFDSLIRGRFEIAAGAGSICFAVGCGLEVAVGQLPFLLGAAFGLLTLAALQHRHPLLAAAVGVACALSSPLAAVFTALAAVAWAMTSAANRRPAVLVATAIVAPVLGVMIVFPQGGRSSFAFVQLLVVVGAAALAWWLAPPSATTIRVGILLYATAASILFVVPTPVGANVMRLSVAIGIPLMVACVAQRSRRLVAAICVPLLAWQWSPAIAVAKAARDPASQESYVAPLVEELAARHTGPVRIEIPFTRDHWESAQMPDGVLLARGWYRQLDRTTNALFYQDGPISPREYETWLHDNGVTFVAVPDVAIDPSSESEVGLIAQGLPFLQLVWHNAHWTLWQVTGSPGLVSGPATVTAMDAKSFDLHFRRAGVAIVRVRYTEHWTVVSGQSCISRDPQDWTAVQATRPGTVRVTATILPSPGDGCAPPVP